MSEYNKNTVGWWLSQLKEPLRSRALAADTGVWCLDEVEKPSLADALEFLSDFEETGEFFWYGAQEALGDDQIEMDDDSFREGYRMAKECAPGGEEKQPDPPAPKAEIFRFDAHEANVSFDTNWVLGNPQIGLRGPNGDIVWSKKAEEVPFLFPNARIAYSEPKHDPIETIDGRHDREIKESQKRIEALEARVKELEGDVTYWKDLCANLHKAWDRSRKMQE